LFNAAREKYNDTTLKELVLKHKYEEREFVDDSTIDRKLQLDKDKMYS